MKALKLILTFSIILGAIVGLLYLLRGVKPIHDDGINDDRYNTYRDEVKTEWSQKNDWDEELFRNFHEKFSQLTSDNSKSAETLQEMNTKTALGIVKAKIYAEWNSSSCRKTEIEKYYKAVTTIETLEPVVAEYEDVACIKNVYKSYCTAYNFANQSIGLTPTFNGTTWNSFNAYRNGIISKRDNILNDNNYKQYLSNITSISNALSSVDSKLSTAKSTFYSKLADKIYSHYDQIAHDFRTQSHLDNLTTAIRKYEQEYSSNGRLNTLRREYNQDIYRNRPVQKDRY